jgi:hypothetical protein
MYVSSENKHSNSGFQPEIITFMMRVILFSCFFVPSAVGMTVFLEKELG